MINDIYVYITFHCCYFNFVFFLYSNQLHYMAMFLYQTEGLEAEDIKQMFEE